MPLYDRKVRQEAIARGIRIGPATIEMWPWGEPYVGLGRQSGQATQGTVFCLRGISALQRGGRGKPQILLRRISEIETQI